MEHHVEIKQEKFEFSSKLKSRLMMIAGLGLVLFLAGLLMNSGNAEIHTKRMWSSVLLAAYYTFLISLGAGVFIGIAYLTNAGWNVAFKRVAEALMQFMPIAAIVLLVIFFTGHTSIYEWTLPGAMEDPILQGKNGFLNFGFFVVTSLLFFGVYFFLMKRLRNFSIQEDAYNDEEKSKAKLFYASRRVSAAFILIFGFTFPIVAWEWMMSIEPHWFSTIYSIYNFAILWVCAITTIALICLFLKHMGYLNIMNEYHFQDLGKMMFAFSVFWTYIWLSQYLLIWYANLPEESVYYVKRGAGTAIHDNDFEFQFWINLLMNFVAPLIIFMASTAKKNPKIMSLVGAVILLGHWNDLYLMIMPGVVGEESHIGLMEIGATILMFGAMLYTMFASLAKHNLIPIGHPYLKESSLHEVAP